MTENKISLNEVVNKSLNDINGQKKKFLLASIVQYTLFLLTYFLTHSLIISFVVYSIFLPSQTKFLNNLRNGKIEDVFVIGKKIVPYLLLSLFFTFMFGIAFVALIFPMVIFFANYALVFDVKSNEDLPLFETLKEARNRVNGHKKQMAWLCLAFLLMLLLLIGFGILLMGLLSLLFPSLSINSNFIWSFVNIPAFYFWGTFIGTSIFMIFVLPFELICISNFGKQIDELKNNPPKEEVEIVSPDKITVEEKEEPVEEKPQQENKKNNNDNPSDYIF